MHQKLAMLSFKIFKNWGGGISPPQTLLRLGGVPLPTPTHTAVPHPIGASFLALVRADNSFRTNDL